MSLIKANISRGAQVSKGLPRTKVYDTVLNELAVLKAMTDSPHVVQLHSFMHPEGG